MTHFTTQQLSRFTGRFNWGDTTDCIYCGGKVEPTDYSDGEGTYPHENLSLSNHHFACWHSGKHEGDGRWMMVENFRHPVEAERAPNFETALRFPWLNRAIQQAEDNARNNTVKWTFVVVDRTTGEMAFSIHGKCRVPA